LAECRTSGDERDVATTLYCLVDPSAIVQPEELRSRTRREIVEGCTELVEADRDPSVVAHARFTRGLVAHFDEPHTETGDLEAALSYFEEAGPASQAWVVRQSFGALEAYAGNLARARELITACLGELDQYAAKGRHVSAKMSMALIDARDRRLSDAARWSGEALRIVIDTDFPEAFIDYALIAALVLRLDGRLTDAARLQGAVMGSVDAGLAGLWPHGRSLLEEGRSELRVTLGLSAVERAEQDGRREGFVAVASATLPLLDELACHEGA
jgi:hypothetical protein